MSMALAIAQLIDTLTALESIARAMHPSRLEALVETLGDRDQALRDAMAGATWPEALQGHADRASEATLQACQMLRAAVGTMDAQRQTYRALRQISHAQEALYPLASALPIVDRYFNNSSEVRNSAESGSNRREQSGPYSLAALQFSTSKPKVTQATASAGV